MGRLGAPVSTRGDGLPHVGQAQGSFRSAMGRSASKPPQAPHV
jgi:hypothetical protein